MGVKRTINKSLSRHSQSLKPLPLYLNTFYSINTSVLQLFIKKRRKPYLLFRDLTKLKKERSNCRRLSIYLCQNRAKGDERKKDRQKDRQKERKYEREKDIRILFPYFGVSEKLCRCVKRNEMEGKTEHSIIDIDRQASKQLYYRFS